MKIPFFKSRLFFIYMKACEVRWLFETLHMRWLLKNQRHLRIGIVGQVCYLNEHHATTILILNPPLLLHIHYINFFIPCSITRYNNKEFIMAEFQRVSFISIFILLKFIRLKIFPNFLFTDLPFELSFIFANCNLSYTPNPRYKNDFEHGLLWPGS